MRGVIHVEVLLLFALFVILIALTVATHWLAPDESISSKWIEWGGIVLGALILALTGRNNSPPSGDAKP